MAIQWISGDTFTCVSGDTKPTLVPTDTKAIETNTDDIYRFNGTSWVLYLANDKTETLTNKTIDSDVNTVKLPLCSVMVYKAGTTYKAKDMESGTTLATTSTTDASVVINAAINNIPGAAARGWGGRVFIHAGDYDCKTSIVLDIATTTYHGVELEGEGLGTRLNFTPSSALTDGIQLKMSHPALKNMRIYGNANVTNLVHVTGRLDSAGRNDYGVFQNVQFDGTTATFVDHGSSIGIPTVGQKGIFMEGGDHIPMFFWDLNNVVFRGLDIGIHCYGIMATSTCQENIKTIVCNVGEKLSGGQHLINNCWFQGESLVGRYGIWLANEGGSSGGMTKISNVVAELNPAGQESAAVYIGPGAVNCEFVNVVNGWQDFKLWFSVLDRSGANLLGNVNHTDFRTKLSQNQFRYGAVSMGLMPVRYEDGILANNLVESSAFTIGPVPGGSAKLIQTTGAINNIQSIRYAYNQTGTSAWGLGSFPKLWVKFTPNATTAVRGFIGLWNTFTAPTSAADILNGRGGAGLWIDTAVSSNWKIMHNDGTGASTISDMSPTATISNAGVHTVEIFGDYPAFPGSYTVTLAHPGGYSRNNVTTNIFNSGILGFLISLEATTAAVKDWYIFDVELELRT